MVETKPKTKNPNKSLRTLGLLVLLTGLLFAIAYTIKQPSTRVVSNSINITPVPEVYSSNGTVKAINSKVFSIVLADGKTVQTVKVDINTEVVKRVYGKSGTYTIVPSKLSAVVVGSQVVFYTKDPMNQNPAAYRLEIIK